MTDYIVIKQHYGDKQYYTGDIRTVDNASTASELKRLGLIGEAPPPKTKSRKKVTDDDNP